MGDPLPRWAVAGMGPSQGMSDFVQNGSFYFGGVIEAHEVAREGDFLVLEMTGTAALARMIQACRPVRQAMLIEFLPCQRQCLRILHRARLPVPAAGNGAG